MLDSLFTTNSAAYKVFRVDANITAPAYKSMAREIEAAMSMSPEPDEEEEKSERTVIVLLNGKCIIC